MFRKSLDNEFIYIKLVEVHPNYRQKGLCYNLIEKTIEYTDYFNKYKLDNAGDVGSCFCYIKTFNKFNYVVHDESNNIITEKICTSNPNIVMIFKFDEKQSGGNIDNYFFLYEKKYLGLK